MGRSNLFKNQTRIFGTVCKRRVWRDKHKQNIMV
ncbi:hypothetical protein BF9343_1390 [Bacteroides fragilis NCTC 9343]|uniref:Uncharacterized protein n=1 Tax=Bacteroides fragilis (strain ATCC 25285 / DSM 2151 / CCUG 4856 / JCM 11019 / LMG 10263 / NCTC 9343 / Onslow / VPI 2553 / EN-2) TaxID=272559 RepID=Q5LFC7_BACFN|nr:hypothetical protein BF9343_1390 [Bacteroides fragilis NCTC 9343]